MFEEEVRAAMEASRREALGLSPVAEPVAEEVVEDEEVEKHETKKGKRKRDEEDPGEKIMSVISDILLISSFGRWRCSQQ
jgi:hypothetical protein